MCMDRSDMTFRVVASKEPEMPKVLYVNHLKIPINIVSTQESRKSGYWGLFDAKSATISLAPDLAEDIKVEIIWHELLHSLFYAYRLEDRDRSNKNFSEESVCHVLAGGIVSVMRQNPDLVAWMEHVARRKVN